MFFAMFTKLLLYLFFTINCALFLPGNYEFNFDENKKYSFLRDLDNPLAQLKTSFLKNIPYQSLLQGILEGIHPYEVILCDMDSSSPYVLIMTTVKYVYILGCPHADQLQTILKTLSGYKQLKIICDESVQTYFIQQGFLIQPRIEFEMSDFDITTHYDLPHGFRLKPLDELLLKQSSWYSFVALSYGGLERFLEHSFGFALVDDKGKSVAQAYAVYTSQEQCEIGIVTEAAHQGKGYIVYPLKALLTKCINQGIKPVWNCNTENIASWKTALKFGFKIKRHYAYVQGI